MPLIDVFDRARRVWPERLFVVDDERSASYEEAGELAARIAAGLATVGCATSAPVGVWTPNCATGFLAMLGVFHSGAAWAPVQAPNPVDANLDYLARLDVEALFVHSELAADVLAQRDRLPSLRTVVCVDAPTAETPDLLTWAAGFEPAPVPRLSSDDVFGYLGTGGTTGVPKSAILTQRVIDTCAANFLACMPAAADAPPVNLLATPMTHGSGFTAFPLFGAGATNVVIPRAQATAVLDAIERHGVTHVFLPPTVVYDLLAEASVRDRDLSSLRHLIYAAAPMSPDKLRTALDVFGPVMTQVYGQAEAPLMCTYLSPAEHLGDGGERLQSCGRATPFTPVTILDDEGGECPPDTPGEIAVAGPLVMRGYHGVEPSTSRWHRTGDVGTIDAEGYVRIVDRKRDMIISGGFNVFPTEVEAAVLAHPDVKDCAVVGAPHERWGEEVIAVVELMPGAPENVDDIRESVRARLGGVRTPKRIIVSDALPRSAVGKVLRRSVREQFWTGKERRI